MPVYVKLHDKENFEDRIKSMGHELESYPGQYGQIKCDSDFQKQKKASVREMTLKKRNNSYLFLNEFLLEQWVHRWQQWVNNPRANVM